MADVLKVAFFKVNDDNAEHDVLAVTSGHTYTVLSVSICDRDVGGNFNLYIRDDAGADDYHLYSSQSLPDNATFIHNDKFVMMTTDTLAIKFDVANTAHVIVSYLDQN